MKERVLQEALDWAFEDNDHAWALRSDGTYERSRAKPGEVRHLSTRLLDMQAEPGNLQRVVERLELLGVFFQVGSSQRPVHKPVVFKPQNQVLLFTESNALGECFGERRRWILVANRRRTTRWRSCLSHMGAMSSIFPSWVCLDVHE